MTTWSACTGPGSSLHPGNAFTGGDEAMHGGVLVYCHTLGDGCQRQHVHELRRVHVGVVLKEYGAARDCVEQRLFPAQRLGIEPGDALTSLGKCFSPPGVKVRLLPTEHDGERAGTRVGGVQAGGGFELSREVRIESGRLHGEIEDVIAAVSLYAGSQYAGGSDTGLAAHAFLLEYGYPHTGLCQRVGERTADDAAADDGYVSCHG